MHQHRCLYDNTAEGYKDQARRNKAWDDIGQHLNVKGEHAKEAWEKLRRCFMNAIKRRKTKQLHPWRYEQRMSFLYDHIDPSKLHGKYESAEQPYYSETDDSRLVDEIETTTTTTTPTDSRVYEDSLAGDGSEISASIKREQSSDGCLRSESGHGRPMIEFLKPTAISSYSMSETDSQQGKRPISEVDLHESEPSDGEEVHENRSTPKHHMDAESRRAKKQCRRSHDAPVRNETVLSSSSNDQDDVDLFFLSMAKTTKTLAPIDQAKIKLQISQLVLGAQIDMLGRNSK